MRINVLHVNIRSIKRNFENLKALEECEYVFNIICVPETLCSNTNPQNNLNLSFKGFASVPYERSKNSREGGVLIFIKRIFLIKFEKIFLNLMNIKKYFPWKFRIKVHLLHFWVAATSHPRVTMSMFQKSLLRKRNFTIS